MLPPKPTPYAYTVRLNQKELSLLQEVGFLIQQQKISTIIKQLAINGARELKGNTKTQGLIIIATNNTRRNITSGNPMQMFDRELV